MSALVVEKGEELRMLDCMDGMSWTAQTSTGSDKNHVERGLAAERAYMRLYRGRLALRGGGVLLKIYDGTLQARQ